MIERLALLAPSNRVKSVRRPGGLLRLRRAWTCSPEHLLLEYDGDEGIVAGQWMRDRAALRKITAETAERCPGAGPLVTGGGVLLHLGGADRRLPGLRPMLAAEGSTFLSHRPERRAVLRLDGPAGRRFAKVVRPRRLAAVLDAARAIGELPDPPFAVPDLLDADERAGVVIWSALEGRSLHELLGSAERLVPGARAAGEALRWLHDETAPPEKRHEGPDEIGLLQEKIDHLAGFDPILHQRLGESAPVVFGALANGASRLTAIHRDFYDKQVFWRPDGKVGLLDFDTASAGEAALDVANMLVHLELRALQGRCTAEVAAEACRAFLAGYAPSAEVTERLGPYAGATRLRLACLYALRPRWRHLPVQLLERLGRAPGSLFVESRKAT